MIERSPCVPKELKIDMLVSALSLRASVLLLRTCTGYKRMSSWIVRAPADLRDGGTVDSGGVSTTRTHRWESAGPTWDNLDIFRRIL